MLVGRLVEAPGLLKMSSVVRAARLHLRRGRSSRLNGWELLLLLVVHVVVDVINSSPATRDRKTGEQ